MSQTSKSRIPKSFIDDLLVRTDIVEIIGNRIQLRKTGSNFTASCPFHNEKTPSFTVSPNKQFYYCFGCGAHGNAISFIMNFDRMEFVEAIETLASYVGLEVPREISKSNDSTAEYYQILTTSNQYYQRQLRQADNAISYLKARGLSGEISKLYNVGYAPPGWNNLLTKLGKNSTLQSQLVTTGMLVRKDNGHLYDRFRDRIMFPIRNQRGNVVGFGGRSLGDETPKYLNSPETPIFNKSQELYGLYEAKQNNKNLSYIIIVEGYMDVISLAQHGITCAVATLGTATMNKHIQKLLRYTSKIVFCFDGDMAGKKAAWRALQVTLPLMREGIQVSFLFLPENEDPDSQIRKEGQTSFSQRIYNAIPLSEFFFTQLIEEEKINMNTTDGRARMAQRANQLLNKIPNGIFYQLMLKKLAEKVHLDIIELKNLSEGNTISHKSKYEISTKPSLVLSAIKLLIHHPHLAKYVEDLDQIANIDLPYIKLFVQLLALLKQRPNITTGGILEYWRDKEEAQLLAKLTVVEVPIATQNLQNEFIDTIKRLQENSREQAIQKLLQETDSGSISFSDKQRLQKLIVDAKINHLNEE
ncbi:MAG: hypothetical protein AMJ43_02240 [Coxiella sp. DG_40]|nr:MAG: hypothetical protein AMJ43_02240 [Coxiella sp. DG_40]